MENLSRHKAAVMDLPVQKFPMINQNQGYETHHSIHNSQIQYKALHGKLRTVPGRQSK